MCRFVFTLLVFLAVVAPIEAREQPNIVLIVADDLDELDRAIGKILDELDDQGITRETLVWFISDNGELNSSAAPQRLRQVLDRVQGYVDPPFRKGKSSVYEGGVRVPSILSWPGKLAQREVKSRITVQDILPTVLSVAGVDFDSTAIVDGIDQWPAFDGTGPVSTPDFVTSGVDGEGFYRGKWKAVVSGSDSELYNLIEDPFEQHDVAATYPKVLQELSDALTAYPRGASIHSGVIWNMLFDPDRFGGAEDREPWASQVKDR